MNKTSIVSSVTTSFERTGASRKTNKQGMREMQERVFQKRGQQYLLIKAPPASGKSRALMFVALDKLYNQGIQQTIIVVPEISIGASFANTPLSQSGFFTDWKIEPKWNLCDKPDASSPARSSGTIKALRQFLDSDDKTLICTHATFRFAVEKYGVEAFDNRLVAIDEFHHVSINKDNKLGNYLTAFIERNKAHIVAMTGSFFRGDAIPVLMPEDEAKFETVTYTYYEQLNGYDYLKTLNIGYHFYTGNYSNAINDVLNPDLKTIVYIPNVQAKESTKDKIKETEYIMEQLGEWQKIDSETGFHHVKAESGKVLKIADLVDDDPSKRGKVIASLKDSATNENRDHVDIIIALGMVKEGFDWVWCEHALVIGYRGSLTEVVQIIGRITRDAPEKYDARFTNLIAEPDSTEEKVVEAVNDTLKAIAASLLMEQVLTPKFDFKPKYPTLTKEIPYEDDQTKYTGFDDGAFKIKGLTPPTSEEAQRICDNDLHEVIAAVVQDDDTLKRGIFDTNTPAAEITKVRIGKIIRQKYPDLSEEDQESIRQHAVAAMFLAANGKNLLEGESINIGFLKSIKKISMDVRNLDIDLIDRINPFGFAYEVISKAMNANTLEQVEKMIASMNIKMTEDEARDCAKRALLFKQQNGRPPNIRSDDPWERLLAKGIIALQKIERERIVSERTN